MASCGHGSYTCKNEGQRLVGSKVREKTHGGQTDGQTDRRTEANLLASSLMRLVARSSAVAEGPRDTQQGLQLTSVTIMNINQDYK